MVSVLVAYATKHNSTAEIAHAIGDRLRRSSELNVDVQPAGSIQSIAPYDAVVLGSAVYIGKWQPAAARFLKKYEDDLAQRPVWLFSSGPTAEGDPVELLDGWRFPDDLRPIAQRIVPRDTAVFHGKLDLDDLNFIEKYAIKMAKAPTGDFRDWDMIHEWADMIARELVEELVHT